MIDTLKIIRAFYISSLLTLVTATIGCNRNVSAGVDMEHATQVTFAQLKEATQGENYFYWIGSDNDFHYFETKKGFYRLATEFEIPKFQITINRKVEPGTFKRPATIEGEEIRGAGGSSKGDTGHFDGEGYRVGSN